MRPPTFLIVALFSSISWALHESDVGVLDWHKKLIGVPLTDSPSTAPIFHRVGSTSTRSIVLSATASNVLGALEPSNGTVAWRYVFDSDDTVASFYAHENVVTSLSGTGGATFRAFDALNGSLILERRLHEPSHGQILEPRHLGTFVAFSKDSQGYFILHNGASVRRLDSEGKTAWTWTSHKPAPLLVFSKIVATATEIYVVGLSKRPNSYKLHVVILSAETGALIKSSDISSHISDGLHDFIVIQDTREAQSTPSPRLVWLDQGSLNSMALTPNLKSNIIPIKGSAFKRIYDVGLSQHGRFIGVKEDGSSRLFKLVSDESALKSIWEFSPTDGGHAEPHFAGGLDKNGNPYVARARWSHTLKQVAVDVYTGHLGKGLMTAFTVPFDTQTHGVLSHVALDCVNPKDMTVVSRLVITTSTGAVQLWQQGDLQWTREESLANIAVADLVELPEKVDPSHVPRDSETFAQRIQRQIIEAQDFPQYAIKFIKRFVTGSYASASSAALATDEHGKLSRDTFGFRQVIVVATPYSKVFGIDSSNGEILWSRIFGLGWAAEVGASILPVKLYVTQTVNDGETPQVVLVAQRRAQNSLIDTVVYHIDASTGANMAVGLEDTDVLNGIDIISGPLVESFVLPGPSKVIVLLDEFMQVYLYPDTPTTSATFAKAAKSLHFPLRVTVDAQRRVAGYQASLNPDLSDRFVAHSTWTLSLPAGEDVKSIIPSTRGPIASIGKVLGNRTTLYKYLNPRLFVVLTASKPSLQPSCGIYLVDAAKGTILHHTNIPAASAGCDVHVSLTENWLSYHYYDGDFSGVGQAKGYRFVSVELYEGKVVDDKTKSSEISAFSSEIMDLTAYEQAYVFPHGITALATTSTKFGITSKDLIVATKNHKIISVPRRLLNPRRPSRKVTTEEQEEFLIPYDPMLPDDSHRTLSHNYEVANVRKIVTAPALLESTSLVFAYGLDLFLTRVTPSNTFDVLNESFNKGQLVVTVLGLAIAIIVTGPMVRRKRLRERWYQ